MRQAIRLRSSWMSRDPFLRPVCRLLNLLLCLLLLLPACGKQEKGAGEQAPKKAEETQASARGKSGNHRDTHVDKLPDSKEKESDLSDRTGAGSTVDQKTEQNQMVTLDKAVRRNSLETSGSPVLRVETSGHSGDIISMTSDAAGKYLVTASRDRTARVWDAATGTLLRILRIPIRETRDGLIRAAAISPGSGQVAVAADVIENGQKSLGLFVFDRASGQLIRQWSHGRSFVVDSSSGQSYPDRFSAPKGARVDEIYLGEPRATALAYSRDGQKLAISYLGIGGKNCSGYLVYSTRDWSIAGHGITGREQGGTTLLRLPPLIQDITFDPAGNLLLIDTAARLHRTAGSSFKIKGNVRGEQGHKPSAMAISPDGSSIAVGYLDRASLDVYTSAFRLRKRLPLPKNPAKGAAGNEGSGLLAVAWSADGQELYAGGTTQTKGRYTLHSWAGRGLGARADIAVAPGKIEALAPISGGGMAYATSSPPSWGIVREHELQSHSSSPIAHFSAGRDALDLDAAGTRVRFKFGPDGEYTGVFSLPDRALVSGESVKTEFSPSMPDVKGLRFLYEAKPHRMRLNGTWFNLLPDEQPRAWTRGPLPSSMVFGSNQRLMLLESREVKPTWETTLPSALRAVNVTSDDRLVVAALSDGTLRWFRAEDGRLILSTLIHSDGRRWVAWSGSGGSDLAGAAANVGGGTSSGYFDASAGGDELVGWQVNYDTKAAPDFYAVGRFRDQYYRPGIGAEVVETLGNLELHAEHGPAATASEPLLRELPPVVTILSPEQNARVSGDTLRMQVVLRSPSGAAITGLNTRIDGRAVPASDLELETASRIDSSLRALYPDGSFRNLTLKLPGRSCVVSVIARAGDTWGEAADLSVRPEKTSDIESGTSPPPTELTSTSKEASAPLASSLQYDDGQGSFEIDPKLYLLAVGVSHYQDESLSLQYAAKDAEDFAGVMKGQAEKLYRSVEARVLTNEQASRANILDGLEWLERQTTQHDVSMLFMAGHGINDSHGSYHFVPYDANMDSIKSTLIPHSDIQSTLASLMGKTIMFLDTCHARSVYTSQTRGVKKGTDTNSFVSELASAENGVVVFTASSGAQKSLESDKWNNGAFTRALVEGLRGKADFRKSGRITINMVDLYVSERVKELTRGIQTPTTAKPDCIRDYPIAVASIEQ